MIEIQDFKQDFLETAKSRAVSRGEGSCASFVDYFAEKLIEAEQLPDFTPAFFKGTGVRNKRMRVDGYHFDELDKSFSLIIADYQGDGEERTLTKSNAEKIIEQLRYFIDQSLNAKLHQSIEESTPAADLIDYLRDCRDEIVRFRLLIFTDAEISTSLKNFDQEKLENISVDAEIWDFKRLFQVCSSDLSRNSIELDFKEFSTHGIPCLEASNAFTKNFKSYLCIISGEMLANIYDKYGSALLEGNVRSFLSTKVAVNKKIRETIRNTPEHFFAYNNGISVTARNIQIESLPTGNFITAAHDFQIINGGQTTASLSNSRFKDKADITSIYVQMKLTEIIVEDEDDIVDIVQNISRSSNSQNKVSDADFFSTHPFHVKMEQLSRKLFAKASSGAQYMTLWFYERARGKFLQEQMRLTDAAKKDFLRKHPKSQLITKTDLAKVRNTWDFFPHIVSRGSQASFVYFAKRIDDLWKKDENFFNAKYYQEIVALNILFQRTVKMVPIGWGYRANIVTYSLALLRKLIHKQFNGKELNLQTIWQNQKLPEVLEGIIPDIISKVYASITDETRLTMNVTQWCKKDGCWNTVQNIEVELPHSFVNILMGVEEIKLGTDTAKEIDVQSQVIDIGVETWKKVALFLLNAKKLLPREQSLLTTACTTPHKVMAFNCKKLLELLERAKNNGLEI